MRNIRTLVVIFSLVAASGLALGGIPGQCSPKVNYRIKCRLNPKKKLITGSEVIQWTNYSPDPIGEIPFHLYMNAFENKNTTFLKEGSGGLRGSRFDEKHTGYCKIKSILIDGMGNLTSTIHYIQPDDNNKDDHTVASIKLPQPVSPGQTITIRIDFETKLPHLYARAGYYNNFYMMGQWYPKPGVLEPPGWRHSEKTHWNCHQYHRNSEFYANFANFDVTLTVPYEYKVGSTGHLVSRRPDLDKNVTTYTYKQECVHDFAWSACPDFIEVQDQFSGEKDVAQKDYKYWSEILGIPVERLKLGDIEIHILMNKQHADFIKLSLKTLKNAIKYYGMMFGPYPYKTITLIDPAPGAFAASGMEYPTLFTAGTHHILKWWPLNKIHFETVITHEFGHNYWYGMCANNEFEEAWLDEGLNSFSEGTVNLLSRGNLNRPLETVGMSTFQSARFSYITHCPPLDPISAWSWKMYPGDYSTNVYSRPEVGLLTIENIMGKKKFFRTLRGFFQDFKFKHPDTLDFIDYFTINGDEQIGQLLQQMFLKPTWLDLGIKSVENGKPNPKTKLVRSRVIVYCRGGLTLNVDIRFRFKNGKVTRKQWRTDTPWHVFSFNEKAPLISVQIDPDMKLALDTNFANNSWSDEQNKNPIKKMENIFQFLVQNIMQLLTFFS